MKKLIGLLLLLALPLVGQASDSPRMKIDSVWIGWRLGHLWQIDTTYWIETEHGYTQVIPKNVLFPSITETITDSVPAYTDSVLWTNGKDTLFIRTHPQDILDTIDNWWDRVDIDETWQDMAIDSIIRDEID